MTFLYYYFTMRTWAYLSEKRHLTQFAEPGFCPICPRMVISAAEKETVTVLLLS